MFAERDRVARQIREAENVAELRRPASQVDALVALLHHGGVGIDIICGVVRDLNRELFGRLWAMLAPAPLVAASCLVVMGSEGRGEQTLRTDQDNALLLADGIETAAALPLAEQFSAALIDFGYPRCPGDIMLSNPLWCQPLASFKETLSGWIFGAEADGVMNLAIFLDAAAVAGDSGLLQQARGFIDAHVVDNDAFFARFANAADQFNEPGGWWARLTDWVGHDEEAIDLKKQGTFPIVHGVRALALQHRVGELGTAARLEVLAERRQMPQPIARELRMALPLLMRLKLDHQLAQRRAGERTCNLVRMSTLGTTERELLRDSLAAVRRFRQHLREHFRLESL